MVKDQLKIIHSCVKTIKSLFNEHASQKKDLDQPSLLKGTNFYLGFIQISPSKLLEGLDEEI
jgi:hypothetical protein